MTLEAKWLKFGTFMVGCSVRRRGYFSFSDLAGLAPKWNLWPGWTITVWLLSVNVTLETSNARPLISE